MAEAAPQEFNMPIPAGFAAGLGQDAFDDIPEGGPLDVGELEGDPAIAFRRSLGMFATGVTVITLLTEDEIYGMTANAFMSVSVRPPLILISVDRRARLLHLLGEGKRFGVNVLREDQAGLSDKFARRASAADVPDPTFEIVRDAPLVEGALAQFAARVVRSYWGGDHSLFIGQVEYCRYGEGTPLLFHGGRYERLIGEANLFASLPPELQRLIFDFGVEREYAAGGVIMRSGDPGEDMLLLLQGSVAIERDGRTIAAGPGEIVGEIELLDPGRGRTATVTATEPVLCVAVSREALRSALTEHPHAALELLTLLASRFR